MVLHCIPRVIRLRQALNSLCADSASVRPSYIFWRTHWVSLRTSRIEQHTLFLSIGSINAAGVAFNGLIVLFYCIGAR
jgi:hypothetical protein